MFWLQIACPWRGCPRLHMLLRHAASLGVIDGYSASSRCTFTCAGKGMKGTFGRGGTVVIISSFFCSMRTHFEEYLNAHSWSNYPRPLLQLVGSICTFLVLFHNDNYWLWYIAWLHALLTWTCLTRIRKKGFSGWWYRGIHKREDSY